jgi:general nucleoside transport system ATP-binding protein
MTNPALELRGISKRFGSVQALNGADFVLGAGEVHGLLGENGAGKSTLMHVVYGLVRPDQGTIRVRGNEVRIRSPRDARAHGLGMVHQHFTSIPTLTVEENLWLAAGKLGSEQGVPPTSETDTGPLRARLWEGLDPRAKVETLPVGAKQRLEILQALATNARILLLDEPTAVLAPGEVEGLLKLLREFAAGGGSVVIITHKLDEIFSAADRVTVLRHGTVVLVGPRDQQSRAGLARAMVGEQAQTEDGAGRDAKPAGPVVLAAPGLELRAREVVGIAAVEGHGQRELLRWLAGVDSPSPSDDPDKVAFVPEDRSTEGLIPEFSLTENLVLGLSSDPRWRRGTRIRWSEAEARVAEVISEYGIQAAGPSAPARTLSGGNQQKLVFARAIEADPKVVIAENPTRGLDINATRFVHDRLRWIARGGAAVVVYSTDLDEILGLADRILVIRRGAIIEAPRGATRYQIGEMMLGAEPA